MPKKPPARRAKRARPPSNKITDVLALLRRLKPPGLSETAWAKNAGVESAFKELKRKPDKSMTLESLDKLAVYAGFDDFVHHAGGQPRFDRTLFRNLVAVGFRARALRAEHDDEIAPETWAKLLLVMFERASREPGRWDTLALTDDLALLLENEAEDA